MLIYFPNFFNVIMNLLYLLVSASNCSAIKSDVILVQYAPSHTCNALPFLGAKLLPAIILNVTRYEATSPTLRLASL